MTHTHRPSSPSPRPGKSGGSVSRPKPPVTYGGQAVLEGVMMRGPQGYAVSVRSPAGDIITRYRERPRPSARYHILGRPFVRGLASLADSLVIGIESLLYSADQVAGEDEKLTATESTLTVAVSLVLSVALFMLLPTVVAGPLLQLGASPALVNLSEGLLRLMILVAYVWAIGLMPDIRRVYQYHGAEHKVINAYEAEGDYSPEAAGRFPTAHTRCGTSFLLFVVVVSVVLFSLFGWPNIWVRIATRLALLPVIAGLAYEIIRLGGSSRSPFLRPLLLPGLWLQRLSTREPDQAQLEVASAALAGVLNSQQDTQGHTHPEAGVAQRLD